MKKDSRKSDLAVWEKEKTLVRIPRFIDVHEKRKIIASEILMDKFHNHLNLVNV